MSEDIDIGGSTSTPRTAVASQNAPMMDSTGMNNDQFLDQILATPAEQLIPWEEVELPSQGRFYGWPDGICRVRAMGQTAEKILTTQRLVSSGQAIDYLFRECCQFPAGFDPVEMLVGDRSFILFYLRGITHGNIYEFTTKCPNPACNVEAPHEYDLNELAGTIRHVPADLTVEPFRISLPFLSEKTGRDVWISVRFMRSADATDIAARRRVKNKAITKPGGVRTRGVSPRQQQNQNVVLDSMLDDNLEKLTVDVMGNTDTIRIRQFIQKLHARDTATIREWLRDNTPGIDTTVDVSCAECGMEYVIELPITDSFFRPAKR